ncbi:hypothetical protein OH76DRAFT_433823 [Lentinus brumalis]|uniref:Uncharacterized protein n=1 Tax=Lentinus brumalis TaxID=2498619 RepID=A0A371DDX1_9APHY|nr:hypothetical protein OH76DRAFT_433823 [Polyporus brumalis]
MSVARLSLVKPVEVCDELESFYYLLRYFAVRYLRSNCSEDTLADFLNQFVDQYSLVDGHQVCGWKKLHTIATGHLAMAHIVPLNCDSNMIESRDFHYFAFCRVSRVGRLWIWTPATGGMP